MFQSLKAILLLSISLVFGCATSAPTSSSGTVYDSPIGKWTEHYEFVMGEVTVGAGHSTTKTTRFTIFDETSGKYDETRVEFYALEEPRRWKGYWIGGGSGWTKYFLCDEQKGGSDYWGETVFEFNETFNQYTGYWDRCGEGGKFAIRGVR